MMSQKTFLGFQHFEYHVLVEHDEIPGATAQFGGNRTMGARDMVA